MKQLVSIILFILCAFATSASAQGNFLDNLRRTEAGKGKVVVQQSSEIDRLVNGTKPVVTTPPATSTSGSAAQGASASTSAAPSSAAASSTAAPKPAAPASGSSSASASSDSSVSGSSSTPSTETETDASQSVDKRKKVMRNSYKTTGYRIQIYSGGNSRADREKAQRAGDAMKSYFPTEPVYVHFYSPSWKCRMGNYRELAEAQRILAQVKALGYKEACIVKGTISVQY